MNEFNMDENPRNDLNRSQKISEDTKARGDASNLKDLSELANPSWKDRELSTNCMLQLSGS